MPVYLAGMATPYVVTNEVLAEMLSLWNSGKDQHEISTILGLDRGTVGRHLRKHLGVETPNWKGRGRVALQAVIQPWQRPPPVVYPDNPPRLSIPFETSPGEAARFWSKVAAPNENGCRLWLASLKPCGAGQFGTAKSASELAYRVAWQLTYGPIPEDKQINHRCDIRPCNEPTHLWLGTQLANMQDMAAKGRSRKGRGDGQKGEDNVTAKLTWETVRKIRHVRETQGLTIKELARKFGMSTGQICNITTYKQWTDDPLKK